MVVLFRSGKIPEVEKIANRNALWFDSLVEIPSECSPRGYSVFSSLSHTEATGWVDWRLDANLDASIWKITIPDSFKVYLHPVRAYEDARFIDGLMGAGDMPYDVSLLENFASEYWAEKILVEANISAPVEGFWEVLLPYDVAKTAKWELVEYISDDYRETVPTYFD